MFLNNKDRLLVIGLMVLCLISIPLNKMQISNQENCEPTFNNANKISLISLTGMIADDSDNESIFDFTTGGSPSKALKLLKKALKDDKIKAVVLKINSPGGTVSMSQTLAKKVGQLVKKDKLVVVSMGDIAASGGYYIASAANRIFAEPGTLTGSIGVIMDLMNFTGISQKLGISANVIKSGPYKDIGSPFRPMTPAEHNILQGIVDDSYNQFVQAVALGRNMPTDKVKLLANGSIYTGKQALQNHLIDEIGDCDDAIDYAQSYCQKKYHLNEKLKVDKNHNSIFLDSLETNIKSLKLPLNSNFNNLSLDYSYLLNRYNRIPLWLMQ